MLAALWLGLRFATRPWLESASAPPSRLLQAKIPAPAPAAGSAGADRVTPTPLAEKIARALRTGNDADREWVFAELLPELLQQDAWAAGRLAERWPPGAWRDELIRQVARHWAAADIGGAVAWLASLENRADQTIAVEGAAAQIARTDPAGAAEISQYFRVRLDNGSLEHLVQIWTEESPADAVNWISARPPGRERDRLLARIAYVRAQSNPLEATSLVLDFLPAGAARDDALAAVARQWAMRDPDAAAAWAEQLPPGALRTRSPAASAAGGKSP